MYAFMYAKYIHILYVCINVSINGYTYLCIYIHDTGSQNLSHAIITLFIQSNSTNYLL